MPKLHAPKEAAIKKLRRIAEAFEQIANELEAGDWGLRSDTIDVGISAGQDCVQVPDWGADEFAPKLDYAEIVISGRQKWGRK